MIRVQLPAQDRDAVDAEFRRTADRKLRDRLQIALMADRGRRPADIAADLGISTRTVPRWLNAYHEHGPDGLRPRTAKGAAPNVPDRLAAEVRRWVLDGPAAGGRDRANRTYAELADHLFRTHGGAAGRPAVLWFGRRRGVRVCRPTCPFRRADPSSTLGVKGRRPVVGTRDGKPRRYVFAVVHVATAAAHANTLEGRKDAKAKTGRSKTRRMQDEFAAHLRPVGRVYPADRHRRVMLVIDNAPWHRGRASDAALADHPHLAFYRLPSHSPRLNPTEQFRKKLRRRATHNRLFDTPADRKRSIRNSRCYFQTVRRRMASLVNNCFPAQSATVSPNS